jgi:adenylyltransferase/sulfurtransferase
VSEPVDQEARFARQDLLPGFGEMGRHRLRQARVHVVGAGRLAAPALLYLASAGVGTLYLDDGGDVDFTDTPGWLHPASQAGRPRLLAALEALAGRGPGVEVRPYATGVTPSATLICAGSEGVAHLASERARQAVLPQVVALGAGDGGEVVSIPAGAPCLRCATGPAARVQASGVAAGALGSLAALELILLLAGQLAPGGRRPALEAGRLRVAPTARRPGCACARG